MALTEDSETAASLSELRDWAVQHTEGEFIVGKGAIEFASSRREKRHSI